MSRGFKVHEIPTSIAANLHEEQYTGLLKMIVGVLTTCHTQYTWDSSI